MSISIGPAKRLGRGRGRADSELRWARIGKKRLAMLRQIGSYPDISYDHGALLAAEVEDGVFPEILDTIQTGTDLESDVMDTILSAVYRRLSDDVFDACSDEFRAGARAIGDGMFDTLPNPRFTPEDVRDALVAIDVGNLAEGLAKRMEKPLAAEVTDTIVYVIGAMRRYFRRLPARVDDTIEDRESLGTGLQGLNRVSRRVGFGCTAAGAAPALTEDGLGLHARTFDGAFFAWNRYPLIQIVDERATNPAWHRYVAVGTVGLIYSGGISGMNDAGIAASIHQMSTLNYDTGRPGQNYVIAPYLHQRILREAGSLDEAEAILLGARHFASWTIVVSDAAAGASARFEINGGTQRVRRTDLGDRFAQSNHFLHDDMAETHKYFDDVHFTPTFGKWLESRARLDTVDAAWQAGRAQGRIGTDWAIDLMASHADGALDGAPRSFGRTICKAYGIMATIARADPDRARAGDQIWMAVGDAVPGPHATFAGFAIDWDALTLTPVAVRPTRKPRTVSDAFRRACGVYVAAFETLARPRDDRGRYLGRDPSKSEWKALIREAVDKIDRAARRAEDAGEMDFPFRYARARLSLACERHAQARDEFLYLKDFPGLHDWERTLVLILLGVAYAEGGEAAEAKAYLDQGAEALEAVRKRHYPRRKRPHPDLDAWADVIAAYRKGDADAAPPDFDFVTVE